MRNETIEVLATSLDATNSDQLDYTFEELMEILLELEESLETQDDFDLELSSGAVRIIDKSAIDEIWTESLIEMVKDCYGLINVPSFVAIDWEQTAENCKMDGLGHHFNRYDGEELETDNFYIFRTD